MVKSKNMTDRQRRYLEELKQIVLGRLGPGDGRVLLFGSWARDDIRQASDIDLAVEPGKAFDERRLMELEEALEESNVPYRVEVVNLKLADEGFRIRVASEGIAWIG